MISVAEAKNILAQNSPAPLAATRPLLASVGLVLAEDIYSPLDVPSFAQSAMDGYALAFSSHQAGIPLPVTHIIQAGSLELPVLRAGEVARIFTGAPIPQGADTVVMQEKVTVRGSEILILDQALKAGDNVRPRASQTAKGALAVSKGTRLGPGTIGFLASLGIAEVMVYVPPKISLIVTGRELAPLGQPLLPGQVYESNSYTLRAALAEVHIPATLQAAVDDDAEQTYAALAEGLSSSNLLLITGGISVGDYDFVHQALQRAGVETLFYKIKQKPGKPLYCGRKGDTLVFGLPGNPASVLSCYYQYVVPCIRQMMGMPFGQERETFLQLAHDFHKKEGLTHFIKGKMQGEGVAVLSSQESYKMDAFVESDCLIEFEEARTSFSSGELVKVYPLGEVWK